MTSRTLASWLGVGLLVALSPPAKALVMIDWVQVGSPGNACDTQQYCFGAVSYPYAISKYEVTNAQYAEFLNAVAAADPNALYNDNMALPSGGGVTRSGSYGSYSYATVVGRENKPVSWVSWYDSLRFVNWLANGQPTGAQGVGTTETGTYTLTGQTFVSGGRASGAAIFLPTEDEWYKAAYFDPSLSVYYDYPAGTDTQTVCATPTATANRANCGNVVNDTTDVGSYTGSASPFGTFDQGGNVDEWNEGGHPLLSFYRGIRGRGWPHVPGELAASYRSVGEEGNHHTSFRGFRVASVPEPATGLLLMAGMLGLAGWRRRRV